MFLLSELSSKKKKKSFLERKSVHFSLKKIPKTKTQNT